ncbi:MAG: DUF3567 domain-containing protein [Burkholderiales bacterium]|nr:DUF3567 domain-containing protein [Burkholderiales bacterium]
MQLVYNSDSFVVVAFELPASTNTAENPVPAHGGYEIVDKFARKEIFIAGALAEQFQQGVAALVEQGPNAEALDEYIGRYTQMAQQPVVMH